MPDPTSNLTPDSLQSLADAALHRLPDEEARQLVEEMVGKVQRMLAVEGKGKRKPYKRREQHG